MTAPSTCPHCGRTLYSHRKNHAGSCPQNPPVRALILEALTDADRPGWAVAYRTYRERAIALGAPGYDALQRLYGPWADICAAFGLQRLPRAYTMRVGPDPMDEAMPEVAARLAAARVRRLEAEREAMPEGLPVLSVREIDGGRRVAMVLR